MKTNYGQIMNWNLKVCKWFLSLKISNNLWTLKYFIFLILSLLGLTQDDNYSPSASSSSRPSHQGVKRKYKSDNGDKVKTSYPKKEPKIEPEIKYLTKFEISTTFRWSKKCMQVLKHYFTSGSRISFWKQIIFMLQL